MKARRPDFDFSNSCARWAPNGEFAHFYNAVSVVLPPLERFLNTVLAKAAGRLNGDDERTQRLRADIRMFIRQEANHYALHDAYNAILRRGQYDLAPLEARIEAEYRNILDTRSFEFCLAYCDGFETIGPPAAHKMLDGLEDMFAGADAQVVSLWKWHLMEEFEHRTVCFDVLHHFAPGYLRRINGLIFQGRHLGSMVKMVRNHLIATDRKGMNEAALALSIENEKAAAKAMRKGAAGALLRAMLPWYSPRRLTEPGNYRAFMERIEPHCP